RRDSRDHRPGLMFEENFAFLVLFGTDDNAVLREATLPPFAVPSPLIGDPYDAITLRRIASDVVLTSEVLGEFNELTERPCMQEGDQRGFATAQVQAVIPVRPQPQCDAVRADLLARKFERALKVLINRGLTA